MALDTLTAGLILFGYLLGSIPTGLLVARFFGGIDPRTAGSGNIGATNVGRTSGRKAGILTLAGDILKGVVPVLIARTAGLEPMALSLVGGASFLGHCFPLFLGFRGGKGVATACGVIFVLAPVPLLLSALVFGVVVLSSRYVSLGSITGALTVPLFIYIVPDSRVYLPMGIFISTVIVLKHRDNIKRLLSGVENRI